VSAALFLTYRIIGWGPHLIPVPTNRKGPVAEEWQTRTFAPDDFSPGDNIGLRLTQVTDVDLDCSEALALADIYLPLTGAEFGRASKPKSHRLFLSPGASFAAFADPLAKDQNVKATLLELRAGAGHQTIIPPSIADGERREWCGDTIAPSAYDAAKLRRRCAYLAMACLLSRYVSATLAERPAPDFPTRLWEADPVLGRAAYRWLGQPDPDAPRTSPKRHCDLSREEIDLAELVHAIPNNADWHEWNRIGLAIYAASGGSNQGGIVFDDWSAKSPKYNPYETSARWHHYHTSPPSRIGLGTLIHLAREAGWQPAAKRRA
jgi:hypothetical protein